MSAYDEIKEGLEEAILFSKNKPNNLKVYKPHKVNVKTVRNKLAMTQEIFAASFGISLGTLRHWERGDRNPQGAALVLLNAVEKAPNQIMSILNS